MTKLFHVTECGCCCHYHPSNSKDVVLDNRFNGGFGDCRDDNNRFTSEQLNDRFGENGWIEDEQSEIG